MKFGARLKTLGLTKSKLAREMGIKPNTVSKWGDSPPGYALAYLDLLERLHKLERVVGLNS